MTLATYDYLNLPKMVTMSDMNYLEFRYLADGRRMSTMSATFGTPIVLPFANIIKPPIIPVSYNTEIRDGGLTFQNGRLVRYDFPDGSGYVSLYDDEAQTPQIHPYFFITDHLGSVRLTCDGANATPVQGLEYLPSGAIFRCTDYGYQKRKFCGKELFTIHGWNMYDSSARYQYSLLPRFTSIDPLAEKYYHMSPYNYAGNDGVNTDLRGDSIHIGTVEGQRFFMTALSQIFGDASEDFFFTQTGMLSYNGDQSDFTNEQKKVYRRLYKLMSKKTITNILYQERCFTSDNNAYIRQIDTNKHGGAASMNTKENGVSQNYIVVNPYAENTIKINAVTPIYYKQPIIPENGPRFTQMEIQTNMADRTFHELGHIIYAGKRQNKVINFNNHVRNILNLPSRPYDENHNRTIRYNLW